MSFSYLAIAAAISTAACGLDVGPTQPWVPADQQTGVFKPERRELPDVVPMSLSVRETTRPLRVVTFNVQRGEDVEGIAAALGTHPELARAGLILLQEEENHPDEGSSRTERLADSLGLAYAYLPARLKGDATHGLAILSAFPILDLETMELPHADLSPNGNARRIAVSADILIDGRRLHIINVHLDTVLNVTDRILQLRPAVIDAPDAVLVGGDFNTNDWVWAGSTVPVLPAHSAVDTRQAPILDSYMRAIGFATPCADVGPTEHMSGFEFRLDAFYTRGLTVTPGHVVRDVEVSDHWPMWIDVTW